MLSGEARFAPLSSRACLMLYRLLIELPIVDDLLIAAELDGHPASLVVAESSASTFAACASEQSRSKIGERPPNQSVALVADQTGAREVRAHVYRW